MALASDIADVLVIASFPFLIAVWWGIVKRDRDE